MTYAHWKAVLRDSRPEVIGNVVAACLLSAPAFVRSLDPRQQKVLIICFYVGLVAWCLFVWLATKQSALAPAHQTQRFRTSTRWLVTALTATGALLSYGALRTVSVPDFSPDVAGILVARFADDSDDLVQSDIVETLERELANARLLSSVEVKRLGWRLDPTKGLAQARTVAQQSHASLVIWGVRGQHHFYPRVLVADAPALLPQPDVLLPQVLSRQDDIALPPEVVGNIVALARFVLVRSHLVSDRLADAVEAARGLRKSLDRSGDRPSTNTAYLYFTVGDVLFRAAVQRQDSTLLQEAVSSLEAALTLTADAGHDPRTRELEGLLWNNIALAHAQRGDVAAAERELDNLARLQPDSELPHINRAFVILSTPQPTEASRQRAIQALERAIEKNPVSRVALLGKATLSRNEPDEAIRLLEKALSSSQRQEEAALVEVLINRQLARAYLDADPLDSQGRAERLLKTAIGLLTNLTDSDAAFQKHPLESELYGELGALYCCTLHLPAEAETALRKSVALDPANCLARYNLAKVYVDAWRLDEAEREYRTLLQQDPVFVQANNDLGLVYYRRALQSPHTHETRHTLLLEARRYFLREIEVHPNMRVAYENIALVHEQLMDSTQAGRARQRARELPPQRRFVAYKHCGQQRSRILFAPSH